MRPRILIADDDESIRDIFRLILNDKDYNLDIRSNGEEIMNDEFSPPDLFLIDRQLSGVSGLDVCRHLKARKDTMDIPVVMISASPEIARLSAEAGADGHIEKPFEIRHLIDVIRKFTEKRNQPVRTT